MDSLLQIPDQLAHHLRSLRKAKGLSQTALANKLGVTQSRIAAIERNPSALGVGQLFRVLSALDASLVLRHSDGITTPRSEVQASNYPKGIASGYAIHDDAPKGIW